MPYSYQLSYLTVSKTIKPTEVGKIVVAREQDEMFFREKMSGSLKVTGEDYEFLRNAELFNTNCCQEITLSISAECAPQSELFWVGYFNLLDIDWDHDNLEASISKINVDDAYDVVFRNWHTEINLLDFNEFSPFQYQGPQVVNLEYNPNNSRTYIGRDFINSIRYLLAQTFYKSESAQLAGATRQTLSKFLFEPINPVTGKENVFPNTVICHLSDAKRPGASNPATKETVTLKQFLEELRKLLNVYWYIDHATGQIRLEHKTFFRGLRDNIPGSGYVELPLTLDLTAPEYKDVIDGRRKVKTNTADLKGIEGLVISTNRAIFDDKEAASPLYRPAEEISSAYMSYSSQCVPVDDKGQKTEQILNVSLFMTDFLSCLYYPQQLGEDGFVLIHTKFTNGVSDIVQAQTAIEKKNVRNGALSASRIYNDYLLFDASFSYGTFSPAKEGTYKADQGAIHIAKRAKSTKAVKVYDTIQFAKCCGSVYDFSGYIKHPLYDKCVVDKVEYDTLDEVLEVTLVSISECSNVPIPPDSEEDNNDPNCPAYGTFARQEARAYTTYNSGQSIVKSGLYRYYNDGKCGEYESGPHPI